MKHKGINSQTIIELCHEGLSGRAIASRLGVTPNAIRWHLEKLELKTTPQVKYDHKQIVELYELGSSTYKVGALLGIPVGTVARYVRKAGVMRSCSEAQRLSYRVGAKAPSWKGGRIKNTGGYIGVQCPGHPRTNNSGYVLEHILIWEKYHHKKLLGGYVIHHLNGIKDDNRVENLVAMKAGAHSDLAEPYKKRIRQLEIENRMLHRAFEDSQMIFYMGRN